MKYLNCLFACLTFSLIASATTVEIRLQNELRGSYLQSLEKMFGACPPGEECLREEQGAMRLKLPKKEMCFPYTMCGYYKCMEEKYQCSSVGVNYFTELAYPTCSQYVKNMDASHFTEKGKEWIFTVMVCLQKGLAEECEIKGNCPVSTETQKKTCDHITEFTLAYHPGCYINSGVGVCKLPLKDKRAIWKTVSPYLTERERVEAYKVIFHCLKPKG